jgi:DNA-binding NarL/FixJ family response regulator
MLPAVNLRCLIVDDNRGFLEAARSLLEQQGITVVGVAENLSDAVRRVGELQPEVVLADIELGRESGFDLARRIAPVAGTEVVLISTHGADDLAELIGESSAAGFIPKSDLSASAIHAVLGASRG